MDSERKGKTLRIQLPQKSPKASILKPKQKLVRIAKKINKRELINDSLEKDFELEMADGNPIEFLKGGISQYQAADSPVRNTVSRQSIGSSKILDLYKERSEVASASSVKREPRRRITIRNAVFHLLDNDILVRTKIDNIKARIDEGKEQAKEKLKQLSYRERLEYFKQQKSLRQFNSTQKKWNKIESGLTKKLQKPTEELIINKRKSIDFIDPTREAEWCMTLRSDPLGNKYESFIPVGNRLSGIYLKEIITVHPTRHVKSRSCPDLQITGMSKLPLEIKAVKNKWAA